MGLSGHLLCQVGLVGKNLRSADIVVILFHMLAVVQVTASPNASQLLPEKLGSNLSMTMVTNIRHFLDENGEIPELPQEAKELLSFLGTIVEAASLDHDQPMTLVGEICHANTDGKKCRGEIEAWIDTESNSIGWECLECEEDGSISEWEGTVWDRRNYVRH